MTAMLASVTVVLQSNPIWHIAVPAWLICWLCWDFHNQWVGSFHHNWQSHCDPQFWKVEWVDFRQNGLCLLTWFEVQLQKMRFAEPVLELPLLLPSHFQIFAALWHLGVIKMLVVLKKSCTVGSCCLILDICCKLVVPLLAFCCFCFVKACVRLNWTFFKQRIASVLSLSLWNFRFDFDGFNFAPNPWFFCFFLQALDWCSLVVGSSSFSFCCWLHTAFHQVAWVQSCFWPSACHCSLKDHHQWANGSQQQPETDFEEVLWLKALSVEHLQCPSLPSWACHCNCRFETNKTQGRGMPVHFWRSQLWMLSFPEGDLLSVGCFCFKNLTDSHFLEQRMFLFLALMWTWMQRENINNQPSTIDNERITVRVHWQRLVLRHASFSFAWDEDWSQVLHCENPSANWRRVVKWELLIGCAPEEPPLTLSSVDQDMIWIICACEARSRSHQHLSRQGNWTKLPLGCWLLSKWKTFQHLPAFSSC